MKNIKPLFLLKIYLFILKSIFYFTRTNFLKIRIDLIHKIIYSKDFVLIKAQDVSGIKILYEEDSTKNENFLPIIYKLCDGGSFINTLPGRKLIEINNCSFYLNSDFIRVSNENVINEKLFKKEYSNLIPIDSDLIELKGKDTYKLSDSKDFVLSSNCYYFNGTFISHWGHFILEHLAKLEFIRYIDKNDIEIDVFLPVDIDSHIKIVIENFFENRQKFKIKYIEKSVKIIAKRLYLPVLNTFIANNSNYFSPLLIQISDSNVNFVTNLLQSYRKKNIKLDKNIFLGYKGDRNLINYNEVSNLFLKNEYMIVYPHELKFNEKIDLFSSAKNIVGIGSSAFTNTIFSSNEIQILMFLPNIRALETGLSKFNKKLNQKSFFFTGKDFNNSNLSTKFELDIEELTQFCYQNNFFNQ